MTVALLCQLNLLLKLLWNVHFKEKKKRKIIQPYSSTFLFHFNNQYPSFFFKENSKKQSKIWLTNYELGVYIYIYILQPGRELFTNHTKKNNNKSCVIRLPVSLWPQHRNQTETNGPDQQAARFSSVNLACVPVSRGVSLHADRQEVRADAFVSWLRVGSDRQVSPPGGRTSPTALCTCKTSKDPA